MLSPGDTEFENSIGQIWHLRACPTDSKYFRIPFVLQIFYYNEIIMNVNHWIIKNQCWFFCCRWFQGWKKTVRPVRKRGMESSFFLRFFFKTSRRFRFLSPSTMRMPLGVARKNPKRALPIWEDQHEGLAKLMLLFLREFTDTYVTSTRNEQ